MIRIIYQYFLLLLLACLLFLSYFFTETTSGLRTLIQIAAPFIPGHLRIEHIEGKLLSPFSLQNILYENQGNEITLQKLEFDWNPMVLVRHSQLMINHLNIANASIKVSPHRNQEKTSFSPLPFLAKYVIIKQASLQNIALNGLLKDDIKGEINLSYENGKLVIQKTTLSLPDGILTLEGKLATTWDLHWNLQSKHFVSVGAITGTPQIPTIHMDFRIRELMIQEQLIKDLQGKVFLTLTKQPASFLKIKLDLPQFNKPLLIELTGHILRNKNTLSNYFTVDFNKVHYANFSLIFPETTQYTDYQSIPFHFKTVVHANAEGIAKSIAQMSNNSIEGVKNIAGKLSGNLEVAGTLKKPTFTGEIKLDNGQISIPKLGITLQNVRFSAQGNQTRELHYSGSFQSGNGTGTLRGKTDFAHPGYSTALFLKGTHLEAANLNEYEITLSPDLVLQSLNNHLTITGDITIPKAKITPKDFRNTITLPEEVVFIGQSKSHVPADTLLQLIPTFHVNVHLGKSIYIHYQDLETTLSGHLTIASTPDSITTATGELYAVKGTYQAYGQTLSIQDGRLIYTGGMLTNPGLNIKAVRTINTVQTANTNSFAATSSNQFYTGMETLTVGVQILGTLDTPVLSLFSSPALLSQTDILSYLILGYPQSQASSANSLALLSAASALNTKGTSFAKLESFTKQLQKSLGLSEFTVESTQMFNPQTNSVDSSTSLVVGKQLTKDLSLHYTTSIFNPSIYILSLIYKINKHWSIQSETSTMDNGADIMYSIERN